MREAGARLQQEMRDSDPLIRETWLCTLASVDGSHKRLEHIKENEAMWAFPWDWPLLFAIEFADTDYAISRQVLGTPETQGVVFDTRRIGLCTELARLRVECYQANGFHAEVVYICPLIPGSRKHAPLADGSLINSMHTVVKLYGCIERDGCYTLFNQILYDDPTYLPQQFCPLRNYEYCDQLAAQVYNLTGCTTIYVRDDKGNGTELNL